MGMAVKGQLQGIKKFGKMYSITVDREFYGTGSKYPPAKEGDIVAFEYTENGKYKNVDMDTFKVVGTAPMQGDKGSGKPYTGGKSGGGFEERQDVISRQAALNSALQWAELAIQLDILPLPKSGKDRLAAFDLIVEKKMQEFYTMNTGNKYKSLVPEKDGPMGPDGAEEAEEDASDDDRWT